MHEESHATPQGDETTFWSGCSCGRWVGDQFGTDIRLASFHSSDPAECEAAAVEQGDEHRAGQS